MHRGPNAQTHRFSLSANSATSGLAICCYSSRSEPNLQLPGGTRLIEDTNLSPNGHQSTNEIQPLGSPRLSGGWLYLISIPVCVICVVTLAQGGTSTPEGAYVPKSKPLPASPISTKHRLVLVGFVLCGIYISPGNKKSLLISAYFCFDSSRAGLLIHAVQRG